jgi:hypothetical protein
VLAIFSVRRILHIIIIAVIAQSLGMSIDLVIGKLGKVKKEIDI